MHVMGGCVTTSTLIQFDLNRMRYLIAEPASRLSYAAPGLPQELKVAPARADFEDLAMARAFKLCAKVAREITQ